ncbi:MAG: dihydropteroate synthase [Eubacteriaceae bacterium]|jgi:5-methyltetrahydrofolate--homocysteine methyltransferase|nr:dihydropteroate synthase [Eubacteriaceae bacterium]
MIFIGEKINGTIPAIQKAILAKDRDAIADIATKQAQAGADFIDVNAGTDPSRELDDMMWLIGIVEEVCDTPICLDSSAPTTIEKTINVVKQTPMVNSINADKAKLDLLLPLIKERGACVIALAMDESKSGMPKSIEERMEALDIIFNATQKIGLDDSKVFVDPLIMSVSTDYKAGLLAFDCIRKIKEDHPDAHITGGLSNISFGLPKRELINRTFLTLAMALGMDSAVVDPLNTALIESLKATELLLGKDMFCRNYTTSFKKNFESK